MTVVFDGTVLSEAESETDNGTWDKWQVSQSPTQELGFVFQLGASNAAISEQVSGPSATGGVEFEDDAAVDYTTPRVVLAKIMMATPGTLNLGLAEALSYQVGEGASGGTGYYNYFLYGLYAGAYPLLNTWRVIAIDPNEVAWRDAVSGTVTLSTIDYYALFAEVNASAKVENVIHDRLDYMTNGTGLTFTGTGGSLQDFIDFDFGTDSNRMGIVLPGAKEFIINGVLTVGTATATTYDDANRVLVFPEHLVAEGFHGIDVGMSNASNDINFSNCSYIGLATGAVKKFFDTALEVNGTTEVITIPGHGFVTGDYVTYSNEGGTNLTGLTSGTSYFVRRLTDDTFSVYAVGATVGRQNSFTDTTRVGLTADSAPGANHSFVRSPDRRPDHTVTGVTGVGNNWTSCTIDGCRNLALTSKSTWDGGFLLRVGNIDLSTGTLDNATITDATLEEGVGLLSPLTTTNNLTGNTFEASDEGHACRITTAASMTWDNTLTGYWAPADNGWEFSTAQAFTSEQINMDANHGFTTGDAVYYNDEGGVASIGLTDGNKYYVNVVDVDTVTVHLTKAAAVAGSSAVNLTTSGSETHSLYSSKAAVFNDTSSGTLTLNVSGGTTPSVRNAPGATTSVVSSVTVTFDKMRDNSEVWVFPTGVRGIGSEIAEIENATAGTPDNRNFAWSAAASTVVDYKIHNWDADTEDYQTIEIIGFTVPASAVTIDIQQILDRNST